MKLVTTRERIDEVLDGLPESELEPLLEIIVSRAEPVGAGSTEQDEGENALEFLRRLDSGEDDGYDFTVSEQLHAAR